MSTSYKDTLERYISKSKTRRSQNTNVIQDILMTTGASGSPGAARGSSGAPTVMSNDGGGGGASVSGAWGNPDASGFAQKYLTTIKAPNGQKVTVHRQSAQAFQGFLQALWKTGYRPKSIQSYSNRNIAGTGTKSQHAWANAIDIDPYANRGDRLGGGGSRQGILPANINALAQRFGLTWGGTWKSADPMHFEYTKR
jgi:hypothetical protein